MTSESELHAEWEQRARELESLMLPFRFGLEEMLTKINILRQELSHLGESNPIEHVSSRMKSLPSIKLKARKFALTDPVEIVSELNDIAGIRIICSFIDDTYRVLEMIRDHTDLEVLQVKDYVADPKENGYRSIHLIVKVPVFLSTGVQYPHVEVQIRTVAMDFWASVEHKIYYKFDKDIPEALREELHQAAVASHDLDQQMQQLHRVVHAEGFTPPE